MKTSKTLAIVLRRTNYGEADRILQLLTPEGKRTVMAKGVRREKSRLAGGIELFAVCEINIVEGKGDIGTLTSARLVHFYRHIMEDYDRMQFAYDVIKIISKTSESIEGPDWYDVLQNVLSGLDVHSIDIRVVQTWFYLHYAALLGYELSLWNDNSGKKILADKNYHYDMSDRGLVESENGELSSSHVKLLRLIATKPLKIIAQVGGIEQVIGDCFFVARQHAAV